MRALRLICDGEKDLFNRPLERSQLLLVRKLPETTKKTEFLFSAICKLDTKECKEFI